MIADIKSYIGQIESNVNIRFSIFTENGKFIYGDPEDKNFIKEYIQGSKNPFCSGNTFFAFSFNNLAYLGVIKGEGKEQQNYAFLLRELFEGYSSRSAVLSKEEFFKALVLGELDVVRIRKYLKKYDVEDKGIYAILLSSKNKAKEVLEIAENYSGSDVAFSVCLDDAQCVVIKYSDRQDGEYGSASEFADFLIQSVYEETGIKVQAYVGGCVQSIAHASKSLAQSLETKRMSLSMNYTSNVHTYKDFMLYHVLEELPDYKLSEFYKLLTDYSDSQIFSDDEMTSTAEEFLENSLNVSETSRKMFLHRNTLNYRLDKIEKETGLDIRKFSDAIIFRLIILLKNLLR